MKADRCPVCGGEGELFDYTEIVRGESGTKHMKLCRGCNGKGWVEVQDNFQRPNTLGYHAPEDCCPGCGQKRTEPALTGCPMGSHYGAYCLSH